MKRIRNIIGVFLTINMLSNVAYAGETSDKLRKTSDILDILADDNDHDKNKHKDNPGNSKNGKDNHGQNKKK